MSTLPKYVGSAEAERLWGVERRTLFRWARAGLIAYKRPDGTGHWLFDTSSLRTPETQDERTSRQKDVKAIYARVSTRKQAAALQNQIDVLKAKYPDHIVFSDCASGLNFRRKGLLSLLQLAFEGRLRVVRVAHRDRLCRFAYDLIEHVLTANGAKIRVEPDAARPATLERELAEDVLSIVTVFGARLYGARGGRPLIRRKCTQQAQETLNDTTSTSSTTRADETQNGSEEDPLQWAATDLCIAYAPQRSSESAAEARLCCEAERVQLGKQPRAKRERTAKHYSAAEGVVCTEDQAPLAADCLNTVPA